MVRMWRRLGRLSRVAIVVVAVLVLAFAGGYTYFAVRTAGAPPAARLSESAPIAAADERVGTPDGEWYVVRDDDGFVGYRVRERLGIIPAPSDAVGRTAAVEGSMRIEDGRIEFAEFTADLTTLQSDAAPRDGALRTQGLETDRFPEATFRLTAPVDLDSPARSAVVELAVPGVLTLHGITRPVEFPLEARWNGTTFEIAGQLRIHRSDFDLEISTQLGFRISAVATIEAQLTFAQGEPTPEPPAATAPEPTEVAPAPLPEPPSEPVAAGEGLLVASLVTEDGTSSLYTTSLDGSTAKRLTTAPEPGLAVDDLHADWSPDGARLVFSRTVYPVGTGISAPYRLHLVNADGSGLVRLTRGAGSSPAWSPDGSRIAFVRTPRGGRIGAAEIFVVASDGTGLRRLTGDRNTPDDSPAWSPDGTRIAYVSFTSDGNDDLWLMNADGSEARALTDGEEYDSGPAWSPDGSRIAFGRDGDIYTIRADGSDLRSLTNGPSADASPRWSADGARIAFARAESAGSFQGQGRIVVDYGTLVGRVPLKSAATFPDWRP